MFPITLPLFLLSKLEGLFDSFLSENLLSWALSLQVRKPSFEEISLCKMLVPITEICLCLEKIKAVSFRQRHFSDSKQTFF